MMKNYIVILQIFLFIFLFSAGACSFLSKSEREIFEKSLEFIKERKYSSAIKNLKDLTDRNPQFPYGFYYLGVSFYQIGDYRNAISYFQKFILSPYKAPDLSLTGKTYLLIGDSYLKSGDKKNAVVYFKKAISLENVSLGREEKIEIYLFFTRYYLELKNFKEAEKYATSVLKIDPENVTSLSLLLKIYNDSGNREQLKKILQRVYKLPESKKRELEVIIKFDPEKIELQTLLETAYKFYQKKDFNSAKKYIKKYLEKQPSNTQGLNLMGDILYQLKEKEEAKDYFEKSLRINPKQVEIYLYLGKIYYELNQEDKLKEILKKGRGFFPAHKELNLFYATTLNPVKDSRELLDIFEQLHKIYPEDKEVVIPLAQLYESEQKQALAEKLYNKVIEKEKREGRLEKLAEEFENTANYPMMRRIYKVLSENDPRYIIKIANTYYEEGNYKEAEENYLKYLKKGGVFEIEAKKGLARTYLKQEKFKEAETLYQEIISKERKIENYKELSLIYRKQNRIEEVIAVYYKMIEIDDKNEYAYIELGNIYYEKGEVNRAKEFFLKAIELNSKEPAVYHNLAKILYNENDVKSAIEREKEAFELSLRKLETQALGAMTFLQQMGGKLDIYSLKKLSEITQGYRETETICESTGENLFNWHRENNILDAWEEYLIKRAKKSPESIYILKNLARLYFKTDNLKELLKVTKRALEKNSKDKELQNYYALCMEKEGNTDEAILTYKKILEIDENDEEIYKKLILLSEKVNKVEDLLNYFSKKLENDKKNIFLLLSIAEIYEKLNNLQKSKEIYEEILKEDINNKVAQEKLEKLKKQTGD